MADSTTSSTVRLLGILVGIAGIVLAIGGAVTWFTVQGQLANENITVSEDAAMFGGATVDGPLTAYAQADIINQHALESTEGQTYAELDREDPLRDVAMNASFLRASLFTSVVSFGVAAMAMALGVIFVLVGWALVRLATPTPAAPRAG
ncbi:aromatic ring-opening dioxygenase LigA [Nitriliruptoria bacterium AS10]|nr:aromatic ring-opening dioxygenase LigA [Salsipaludibacter albus]